MQGFIRASVRIRRVAFLLSCILVLGFCRPASAAAQSAVEAPVYLDQGWSQADREMFYQTSQGSRTISYDMFLNLEVADGRELFRSNQNSERYGLITQSANQRTNPDGLPIGITKTLITEGRWAGPAQIGVTCAACHTAQLTYGGKRIRIDGGHGNVFDFMAYVGGLDDALQATLADQAKFDRLAARLGASSGDSKTALRARFAKEASRVHQYRSHALVTPSTWGPGRIDAIAAIVNRLVAYEAGIPENFSTPLAPTKIPFLWNSPQGSWNQWRGVQQDPIQRNEAEAMGVFVDIDLHSKTPEEGLFDSTEMPLNLQKIENALDRLAPPKWPEELLGRIDRNKALKGKSLFVSICAGCHNVWPYTWTEPNKYGKRFLRVGLVPQTLVGTDPGQFDDLRPYVITGELGSQLPSPNKGDRYISTGVLYNILQQQILSKSLVPLKLTEAEAADLHGFREFPLPSPPIRVYKAAPRDGVWATAPFLHNGSVPNLYEMLLPAKERTKKFYIGREFDPVKVGLDTNVKSGTFLLDTSLPGNSNAGHSFENAPLGNGVVGPLLTEEQRWAIVEYLKSIPEDAGRVTPFGGSPK
jgi:mono/diheme cytochrome c family protein